uniref:Uncharacterized protein n=1 Tax=Sipha flava TaxID=143950 RepID=A0A2S2Q684_9HEMI
MDCRRVADVVGAFRSPPSGSRQLQQQQPHQLSLHRRCRLYDSGDEYIINNNNNNNNNDSKKNSSCNNKVSGTSFNNNIVTATTTSLIDELEQLRTDNFQLRLRVYNAERRVDRLSVTAHERDRHERICDSETNTDSSSSSSSAGDGVAVPESQTATAATATAAAAVRTIHDLLTVNRRLLALLAATVSAKAVAVSADDKRRWRRLRNHIENYATSDQGEEDGEEERRLDDNSDASTTDSETCTAREQSQRASAEQSTTRSGSRLLATRSPPPPEPDRHPAPEDDSAGSELSRLRARCRRLERSLQQLVNTELWARNRQISKLEQQRYVTQVARDAVVQRDSGRPAVVAETVTQQQQSASPATTTKGILVLRSPEKTTAATAITTPPPVLPDYSEVNFFFSCDEEEDDNQGNSETNTLSSASMDEDTESDDVRPRAQPPIRSTGSAPVDQPRKRQCRPHHRPQQQQHQGANVIETATTTLSSSSSVDRDAAVANGPTSDLSDVGCASPPTPSSRPQRHRTFSGNGRQRPRRRYRPRRCLGCARRGAHDGRPVPAAQIAVADAQVQCDGDDESVTTDGRDDDRKTLAQLRRELDARRRENCRLYDMLLRRRKGRDGPKASFLGDDDDDDAATDSNVDEEDGSPEPYRRAAREVRGRIADLLPPLLSMRSTVDEPGGRPQQDDGDGGTKRLRQIDDRQATTLARLRERIAAYEREELLGGGDRVPLGPQTPADPEDDVLHMDRAALVNVALPRAVDRLRRAILQRLPGELQQQQPTGQENPTATEQSDDHCRVHR